MAQKTDRPIQIVSLQYIDFTGDHSAGIKRLIREISRRAGIPVPINLSPAVPSTPTPRPFSPVPSRPIVQSSQTLLTSFRRPAFIIGLVVLVLILVAAVILPSLNLLTVLTPTTNGSLLPSDSPPPSLPTVIPTLNRTDTPQPTTTSLPTVAFTPTLPSGFTPITKNADWTPQYQTFNGVEMSLVPVGCFMMGRADGYPEEKPVNQQCFDQPFWIDRFEVTNKQYGSEGNFKGDSRPRDSVTWSEALGFCIARGARLPTEREWEYAARGPSNLVYPWGNDFVSENVVYAGNSNSQTADVGSRPAGNSWVGASDLSGNIWEWVSSLYKPYPYKADDGREVSNDTGVMRIQRGGAWGLDDYAVRAFFRGASFQTLGDIVDGFRCVLLY